MRATSPFLVTFAAICIAAAGCSGGSGPTLPSASNAAPNAASNASASARSLSNARSNPCRGKQGCHAQLVAPLKFDGSSFSIGRHSLCKNLGLGAAKAYSPSQSGTFVLRGNVTLQPTCSSGATPTSELYLAAAQVSAAHGSGGDAILRSDGRGNASFVPIGGPASWSGKTWTFTPMAGGIAMTARAKYVFYVVSVPADGPTPSPGPTQSPGVDYVLLQPLSFDGTNFTVVPNSCYQGDPQDAPPYVAPTSGPLSLANTVTVTPTCVPSPLPSSSPLPQLYIVAVDLTSSDVKHAMLRHQAHNHGLASPLDSYDGVPAVAVAGGVNITDNPWNFAPDSPGLTMQAGTSYGFFIAAPLPPTPPPTQSYQALVPLNFDGTTFTVPTFTDCTNLPSPAPYTAPSSGPLTLSASVSIAPTCAPSTSGGGDNSIHRGRPFDGGGGNATPAPLYVVAVASSSSDQGSGGDAAHRARPADSGGNGCSGSSGNCTIDGYAIAGPVNATDNPWNFAPILPSLTLTASLQYTFYIGTPTGDQSGGNQGDNARHR